MQAACTGRIVMSFFLMIVGVVILVFGIMKLLQAVDVPLDANITDVEDVFTEEEGIFDVGIRKYKVGQGAYDKCAEMVLNDPVTNETINIDGPCNTKCPGDGERYFNARSKDGTAKCRDGDWNTCKVSVSYEYADETYVQTFSIPYGKQCKVLYRKGETIKIRHSKETKKAQLDTDYYNPETLGYIISGVGLVVLFWNLSSFVKANSTSGCKAILEQEKAQASSGSNSGFFTGMLLGNMLSGGGSGGSTYSSAEMEEIVD